MKGKLHGMSFPVPTFDVPAVDLTCELVKETTYDEICAEIQRSSEDDIKGFPGYSGEAMAYPAFEACPISSSPSFDADLHGELVQDSAYEGTCAETQRRSKGDMNGTLTAFTAGCVVVVRAELLCARAGER